MLPLALGPYRISVEFEQLIFVSGQIGLDPETNKLAGNTVEEQVRQVLQNLKAILEQQHSGLDKVLKTTIFLINIKDFEVVNGIYAEFFKSDFPARSTVAVNALPKGALVEIEAIAYKKQPMQRK